jgi:hypothetical protein
MRTSPRTAAAALAVAAGLAAAAAPVAVADPASPTPIDCGPYGGVSAALEAAADHAPPPVGTPRPPDPRLRVDPTPPGKC